MHFPSAWYLAQAALSFLFSSAAAHGLSVGRRATFCNGHPELCNRSYGNVSFVGAHDSYAVGTNNLAANQDYDVTQQLNDGIRMLQIQAHNDTGVIQLCHTSCLLYNGGTLADYLAKVKNWMDANTNDIVTLLIVNFDNFVASAYDSVFKAAGLDTLSFAPAAASQPTTAWPTLGSMLTNGTRLVTFLDNGADFTFVPYLIDEFTNVWESAFDVTTSFDCAVNRTKGDPTTEMYLINHFLDQEILGQPAPDVAQASTTNGAQGANSLGEQVNTCVAANRRAPNFMLVDFYEYGGGSVFQVAATINGVTYSPSTPIATPITSSASNSPTSSTGSSNEASHVAESIFGQRPWASLIALSAGVMLTSVIS